MLSTIPPCSNVTRSSLEEMLESIRKRDEKPKDIPPALPARPVSKARLPSARRSLPYNFKIGEPTTTTTTPECLMGGVKKKRERILCKDDKNMSFESNKMPKIKVVPLVDELNDQNDGDGDSALLTEETKSARKVDYVLEKEFQVWCQLSNGRWMSGRIESATIEDAVVMLSDQNIVTVPRGDILPANPDVLEGIHDLIWLSFLNEPSVIHNLQSRYYSDKFYNKAGRVLVALNSFKAQLHKKESLTRQKCVDPHVYATIETVFDGMMRDEENQSIIVSGESGAGKTESANISMQYLAALGGAEEMEYKILQTNRILEAFGNAKTSRNDNSSRFGKLFEIQFSTTGKVCGAKIETFFLEKSRVVQLAEGERSYHIFYQLCSGASSSLKERLNLKNPGEFDYLRQSNCLTIDDVDDAQRFHMLMEALDIVRIPKEEQENAFAMLSAVLWLGNISFRIMDEEDHVEVIADEAVASASKLIGCNVQDLMLTLSTCHVQAGSKNIVQKLTLPQAIDTRDSLAKSIYASLFDWFLEKINKSFEIDKQRAWKSISIIDICGFESLQKNSFEQFRMNYVNEKLQQHFIRHLFKLEQEEYKQEGIDWERVEFKDNQECLNLFEQKPYGLLSLLDEESTSAQATDITLVNKFKHHSSSSPCFKEQQDGAFSIHHYAGEVLYDTCGFLEKNRDQLHSYNIQLLSLCTYKLSQLFASNMLKQSQGPLGPFSSLRATDSEKQRVELKIMDQLFKLMQQLENTKPHFIFCIKPNDKQLPSMFEKDFVLQQLRSCGVLEVVRVSRLGYPIQISHQQFARRYGLLNWANVASQGPLNTSVAILQQFNFHPDVYQVGYTKLFLRRGQIATLDDARKRFLQCIINIQKYIRGHLARRHFLELLKRITAEQSPDQAENSRKEYQLLTKSLRTVPSTEMCMKQSIARDTFYDRQMAVILLQSAIRGWLVRKHSHSMQNPSKSTHGRIGYDQPDERTSEQTNHSQVPAVVVEKVETDILNTRAVLKQKEDENALLRQQLKQLHIRLLENDARMKSVEETWQKQMAVLQMNLAVAKNSNDAMVQNGRPDTSPHTHYYDSEDTVSAPRTPERRPPSKLHNHASDSTPGREPNGPGNAVSHLAKELDQRKQVFNNDVKILVEVKSGQSASRVYSHDDLRKVKKNFEAWKKEFKIKLRETKTILKRGNPESEKTHRSWWGKKSSRR